MEIDFEAQAPIDPATAEVQTLLSSIQGNILKGHGRDRTVHIFVRFDETNVEKLRNKLVSFAERNVTSALQQHIESEQFKKFKVPGALFGNIFLTANGYKALGFSEDKVKDAFSDQFFLEGMSAHGENLSDPPAAKWDKGYRNNRIDAMFLLGDDDKDFLLRQTRVVLNELDRFCEILVIEHGDALRNKDNKEGIEHFGYVDGRSQPIYLTTDLKNEGKTDKWNPVEPLNTVLVKDTAVSGENHFGSYFVFRKLEQNVLAFKTREIELADALNLKEKDRERAGAMAVGRFEDGTPLVLQQSDGLVPPKENNFSYDIDANASKCPFQAHIRKTNPRGDTVRRFEVSERDERDRRITRRGITYGKREKHPNDAQSLSDFPTKDVGLLFMCFQASIEKQFVFMQQSWANNESFLDAGIGLDPVIGQIAAGTIAAPQKWRAHWGDTVPENSEDAELQDFSFSGFVKMKGGEFFFAPSMEFLKTFAPI